MKLLCTFVLAYAKSRYPHDEAQMRLVARTIHFVIFENQRYRSHKHHCCLIIVVSRQGNSNEHPHHRLLCRNKLNYLFSYHQISSNKHLIRSSAILQVSRSHYSSLVVRKPVFGVCDQIPHKLGYTATEDG